MRQAWIAAKARMDPDDLAKVAALIHKAHEEAIENAKGGGGAPSAPSEMALVLSALDEEIEAPGQKLDVPVVLDDGTIMGCEPYEQLDPSWLLAVAQWLHHPPPYPVSFREGAVARAMPDEFVLGLVGDWGASASGQKDAVGRELAKRAPDIAVHLGDVYHCGTADNEQRCLVDSFPHGRLGSYALNSNHEMFAGGIGYFQTLLDGAPAFAKQEGRSYFALENERWVLLGLDSAYAASWPDMSKTGALNPVQIDFVAEQAKKGKHLLILTHHPGLDPAGNPIEPYYSQVTAALDPAATNLWYWGHVHAGYVHRKVGAVDGRCIGHGALPYALPKTLAASPAIEWLERRKAERWPRLRNGFAVLRFTPAGLREEILDSRGESGWSRDWTLA